MKIYLEINEQGNPICNHPQVNKIWIWGGMSVNASSRAFHCVSLVLQNGERHDFDSSKTDDLIKDCNVFLNSIT